MNGNEGEKKIISVSILPIWISFSFWRKNADHHFLYYSLMNHFIGILWGAPNFLKSLRSSCQDCIRCTCHAYLMGFLAPFLQAGMVEPCWSLLMGETIIRTETLERRFCRPNSKPHRSMFRSPRQVEVPLYETCHSMCSKNPFCSIYVDNQTGCFIGDSAAETDVNTQKTRSGGSFNLSKQVFILVVKSLAWKWVWNDHCF